MPPIALVADRIVDGTGRDPVENGFFPGPRMRLSVSILSQTGGHADPSMPCGCELFIDSTLDTPHSRVDGVDAMRRRVREVLRAGADNIKLCTSGGCDGGAGHRLRRRR